MASQSTYQSQLYQPLGNGQIRLLRITERKSNTTYCQLETLSLSSSNYCALSYEWAKYDDTDSIGNLPPAVIVNSHAILATRNLCFALSFLKFDVWYWIDALCINQNDDDERAHQVRMMTQIYQSATQVYAWIGLSNSQNILGMGLTSQFTEDFYASTLDLDESAVQKWTLKWLETKLSDPTCSSQWIGLCEILESSYWTRLWIVQEIVVARNHHEVMLKCGSQDVKFFHLGIMIEGIDKLAQDTLKYNSMESHKMLEKVDGVSTLALFIFRDSILWRNRDESCMQLLELLRRYSSSFCSDPRDRVYALLGVELSESRESLRVDYSITESQVFLRAAQYITKSTGRLDILCACRRPQNPLSLPSWAPDWKLRSELRAANRGWNFGDHWYHGGYDASAESLAFARFSSDGKYLAVMAILLGSIKNICLTPDWATDRQVSKDLDSTLLKAQNRLFDWLKFAISIMEPLALNQSQGLIDSSPRRSTLEVFYETLVEGYYGKERAAVWSPEDFFSYCTSILEARGTVIASLWSKESTINLLLSVYKKLPLFELELFQSIILRRFPHHQLGSRSNSEVLEKALGRCHLRSAQVGDVVAVVRGCSLPILLRPTDDGYKVICELYVHGYMDGEAMGCVETEIQLC